MSTGLGLMGLVWSSVTCLGGCFSDPGGVTRGGSDSSGSTAGPNSETDTTGEQTTGSGSDSASDATTDSQTTDTTDTTTTTTTATTGAPTTAGTTDSSTTQSSDTSDTTGGACPQEVQLPTCEGAVGDPADMCDVDDDCEDPLTCYKIPSLEGFCGACEVDEQCSEGGCTPPNPFLGQGAFCNEGRPCDGCQTDESCNDPTAPHCATVYGVQTLIQVQTCSECATDDHCPNDSPNCVPVFDSLPKFTGTRACVPDCSLPLDAACDDGQDQACQSGICSDASLMGMLVLAACGECRTDADCMNGETCQDGVVDPNGGVTGSRCG